MHTHTHLLGEKMRLFKLTLENDPSTTSENKYHLVLRRLDRKYADDFVATYGFKSQEEAINAFRVCDSLLQGVQSILDDPKGEP